MPKGRRLNNTRQPQGEAIIWIAVANVRCMPIGRSYVCMNNECRSVPVRGDCYDNVVAERPFWTLRSKSGVVRDEYQKES